MTEVTHLECDKAPGPPGGDNRTHHLVPGNIGLMRCRYCGRTRVEIIGATQRNEGG